jgi:AcrR family transcriptional regulator
MQEKVLTAKGQAQADAVLDAAIRCLGEGGYAGTSLQRIADSAGVQKRMVLYYFGSREQLIAAAVERLADDFLARVRARLENVTSPEEVVDRLVEALLEEGDQRSLLAAYFGIAAEAANDPTLRAQLEQLRAKASELAGEILDTLEDYGYELSMERDLAILTALTVGNGVGLELLQRGRTPEFERALALARIGAPLLLFDREG